MHAHTHAGDGHAGPTTHISTCERGSVLKNHKYQPLARLASLLIVLTLALTGCNSGAGETPSATEGEATTTAEEATPASGELMGKPWVTSILQGNLPAEQPEAKDDLYTHYAYQFLSEHQEQPTNNMTAHATDIPNAIASIIDDTSKESHELDQLRIFYRQASDREAIKAQGLTEIQPYLDRVDAVTSIEELNALLTADDFPFSPFIAPFVSTVDVRENFCVSIFPNLLFADPLLVGGAPYQDADSPEMQMGLELILLSSAQYTMVDFTELGMPMEDAQEATMPLVEFEKQYAKFADYPAKHQTEEFGAMAEAFKEGTLTLEDTCALCPNFPLKETLGKVKKDNAALYNLIPEWLEAFNACWTNENLDSLKMITKAKILQESRPYRDPTAMNELLESAGSPAPDNATFAYTACNSLDTFAQVMAKTYVEDVLGDAAKDRITKMSEDLLAEYKDLISTSAWIGEESRANLLTKIDNMNLNILEPDGGYFDYDALELTPTEDGGTLFGNYLKLKQYRIDREAELINQPARAVYAWFAIAPTITNAFYDPSNNSINIYPGYVSSLIYTDDMSDTDLLASLGFTIAHEISHALDYLGSQFDAYGTPTPAFVADDVESFTQKTSSLADFYSTIEVLDGMNVDGRNVVTEATADLSGMQATLALANKIEGFDFERFCVKFGDTWATVADAMSLQATIASDNHPLHNLRMNVNMQMFDTMYEALGVTEGDTMYLAPEKRIVIWGENAS